VFFSTRASLFVRFVFCVLFGSCFNQYQGSQLPEKTHRLRNDLKWDIKLYWYSLTQLAHTHGQVAWQVDSFTEDSENDWKMGIGVLAKAETGLKLGKIYSQRQTNIEGWTDRDNRWPFLINFVTHLRMVYWYTVL